MDLSAAQTRPSAHRPRAARAGAAARTREPWLGLSTDRGRTDQAWLPRLAEHDSASACCGWARARTAAPHGELASVSAPPGGEPARLRLLHRRDGHAAPPLRALLHRTREPARPLRRLYDEPDRGLGRS